MLKIFYTVKTNIEEETMEIIDDSLLVSVDGDESFVAPEGAKIVSKFDLDEYNNMYIKNREYEYPSIEVQLDMMYWDGVNGTNTWGTLVQEIKTKYPKGVTNGQIKK